MLSLHLLLLLSIFIKVLSFSPLHSSLSSYYVLLARSKTENVLLTTAAWSSSSSGDNRSRRRWCISPLRATTHLSTIINATVVQLPTAIVTNINAHPILAPLSQQEADFIMNDTGKPYGDSTATVSTAGSTTTSSSNAQNAGTSTTTTTTATTTTVIYGIRHACSIANEYLKQKGNEWGDATFRDDIMFRDARLSAKGFDQVDDLSNRLLRELKEEKEEESNNNHWLNQVELVVVSPLKRCLQTWEFGCRPALVSVLEAYKKQQQLSSFTTTTTTKQKSSLSSSISSLSSPDDDPEQSESTSSPPSRTRRKTLPIKVIVLPLATERVYTAGETGSSVQELKNEFADDTSSSATKTDTLITDWSAFDDLNDDDAPWWYHENDNDGDKYDEWRPHGQGQYYAVPGEPWEIFDSRMNRFKAWLQQRPEQCILVVSHWGVLNHLTGQDLKNCGMVRMEI